MANNPNVNKVVYGNTTVMDISDTTAEEGDVVTGKTFYKKNGARSTGSAVIPDISNCYQSTDTAETDLQDTDYVPFYDTSASGKRNTLWSNIKAKLKAYFDNVYATLNSPAFTGTPTAPTASRGTNTTQIATTAFVHDASPETVIRDHVTASAGTLVRIPASGEVDALFSSSSKIFIPVAQNSTGVPIKFSELNTYDGYVTIKLAQAVSNIDIGIAVIRG